MAPRVPEWIILKGDGTLLRQELPGQHPTSFCRDPGDVLAFQFGPFQVVVVSGSNTGIDWLTTVQGYLGGEAHRIAAPGLVGAPGRRAVRMWLDPARMLIALTDGPLELLEGTLDRLREARAKVNA